jgi:hypothetical protein
MAASEIPVTTYTVRRGPAQGEAAEESGMLTEPCRGIFMLSGRRIFK